MSREVLPAYVGVALRIIDVSGGVGVLASRGPMKLPDGLCAQTDPEVFFPEAGASPAPAQVICGRCALRLDCAVQTIVDDASRPAIGVNGVSGGMSRAQRLQVRRQLVAKGTQEAA